ncbi:MAG: cytidine deaminase [Alphaproteobacteria bacterium]|nr:cytidine deaminase [Alphaproteobacteria bacterium]
MSSNPFVADAAVPARLARHSDADKARLVTEATALIHDGIMAASDAQALVASHGIDSVADLMLLLIEFAKNFAQPPISHFLVGAIGLEAESGDLVFGGNVEFPGTHLGTTLHGEGFVATRAFNRGTRLTVIAIGEAHPCAHCRQYLSEFAGGPALLLIDPLGHSLPLSALYPWPFDPGYLGEAGAMAGAVNWPALHGTTGSVPPALLAAGKRSHTPYSRCPGAVMLALADGAVITGSAIESVAFNPSMSPLQSAIVDLLARGYRYGDITGAVLGYVVDGAVDYRASTTELLATIAPGVTLTVVDWTH